MDKPVGYSKIFSTLWEMKKAVMWFERYLLKEKYSFITRMKRDGFVVESVEEARKREIGTPET